MSGSGVRVPGGAQTTQWAVYVSASVELARVVLGEGRAKFVNAVLRKVAADDL
ncbi:transcription antitermination factor NusB, partial [Streptomyces sp. NPDC005146]